MIVQPGPTAPDTLPYNGSTLDMQIKPRTGAIILIVVGALFLLSNLGWLSRLGPFIAQWWPLILIAVGVSMLLRR
jgi:hypothetical protein